MMKRSSRAYFFGLSLVLSGISISASATPLQQFLKTGGCNLVDDQLKRSSGKIDKFVEEKEYLKAWQEFNLNFWQSDGNKEMSCYYNQKKADLTKYASDDLKLMQQGLDELAKSKDTEKYEQALDGFKQMFGQFWYQTSPGGPMKEPLTGEFYQNNSQKLTALKEAIKREQQVAEDVSEKAKKKEQQHQLQIAKLKADEQERLVREREAKDQAAKQVEHNAAMQAQKELFNSPRCKRVKNLMDYCQATKLQKELQGLLDKEQAIAARSGYVNKVKVRKYTETIMYGEEQAAKASSAYKANGGNSSELKCSFDSDSDGRLSFSLAFVAKVKDESQKACGVPLAID